jgi:hypothetical protein
MTGRHHAATASEETDELVVDVLVDGTWRRGVADWTEHHDGAWHIRVHVKDDSLGHREVWCRFPDEVRFRPAV